MKATLTLGSLAEKMAAIWLIAAVVTWVFPHTALGASSQTEETSSALVFDTKQKETLQKNYTGLSYEEVWKNSTNYKLSLAVKEYLEAKKSPFANCENIITQENWKKIIARSAAESAFGKRSYNNNAWGVMAGTGLKKMGNDWCEAIVEMNTFLNTYPKRATVKYAQMTIEQECGIYKQPCGFDANGKKKHHWIDNNYAVLRDLEKIEKQVEQEKAVESVQVGLS